MSLSVYQVGQGTTNVLLLHGFLGSGRNLTTLAKRLSERNPAWRLVVPDLTGHGTSPPLPDGADLGTLAADVMRCVDGELEIIGHSLGGRVGLRAAMAARDRVRAVTLLDITPSPIPDTGTESSGAMAALLRAPAEANSREVMRDSLRASGLASGLVEWLLLNLAHEAGIYRWRIDRAALAALHPRVNREDLWAALEGTPVRCVRAGRSPYVPDEDVRRMQRLGAPVTTIAEAGHFIHVDALQEVVDAVSEAR
jgi:pimeloyl-ACP methyl ester carboxylesterase